MLGFSQIEGWTAERRDEAEQSLLFLPVLCLRSRTARPLARVLFRLLGKETAEKQSDHSSSSDYFIDYSVNSTIVLECSVISENVHSQNSSFFGSTCSVCVRVEKHYSLLLYYESLSQVSAWVVCCQLLRYQCCQSVTGAVTNQSAFC